MLAIATIYLLVICA